MGGSDRLPRVQIAVRRVTRTPHRYPSRHEGRERPEIGRVRRVDTVKVVVAALGHQRWLSDHSEAELGEGVGQLWRADGCVLYPVPRNLAALPQGSEGHDEGR